MKKLLLISTIFLLFTSFGCSQIGSLMNQEASAIMENEKAMVQELTKEPEVLQEIAGFLAGLYRTMIGKNNLSGIVTAEIDSISLLCEKEPGNLSYMEKGDLIGFILKYRADVIEASVTWISSQAKSLISKIAALDFNF